MDHIRRGQRSWPCLDILQRLSMHTGVSSLRSHWQMHPPYYAVSGISSSQCHYRPGDLDFANTSIDSHAAATEAENDPNRNLRPRYLCRGNRRYSYLLPPAIFRAF
jgi:hypothetical protein